MVFEVRRIGSENLRKHEYIEKYAMDLEGRLGLRLSGLERMVGKNPKNVPWNGAVNFYLVLN